MLGTKPGSLDEQGMLLITELSPKPFLFLLQNLFYSVVHIEVCVEEEPVCIICSVSGTWRVLPIQLYDGHTHPNER